MLNIGSENLLNFLVDYLPSPLERGEVEGLDHEGGQPVKRKIADDQPVSAYVFKTVADPFAGRVSYFKVMSGDRQERSQPHQLQSRWRRTPLPHRRDAGQNADCRWRNSTPATSARWPS